MGLTPKELAQCPICKAIFSTRPPPNAVRSVLGTPQILCENHRESQ